MPFQPFWKQGHQLREARCQCHGRFSVGKYVILGDICQHTLLETVAHVLTYSAGDKRAMLVVQCQVENGMREDWSVEERGIGRGSREAGCLPQGWSFKRKLVPSQPRSICPLRWRASLMRSGSRPFKSTDARQPWKPSREATSFGRLLYMPWARPAM